jgi:transposase-like protein
MWRSPPKRAGPQSRRLRALGHRVYTWDRRLQNTEAMMSINVLERIMREIRRRTRVVGNFPDGQSAVMLVAARLRHIAGTRWGKRIYLDMERLREEKQPAAAVTVT